MREISNEEIKRLRKIGVPSKDIAEIAGISRQRVFQILGSKESKMLSKFQISLIDGVKYAGIRDFLLNKGMSITDFCVEINSGNHEHTVVAFLRGKTKGNIKLIAEILKYTGLSFEEAFKEELN